MAWFLDNGTFFGPLRLLNALSPVHEFALSRTGLSLNEKKSLVTTFSTVQELQALQRVKIVAEDGCQVPLEALDRLF